MNINEFEKIEAGTMFAQGVASDSPSGLHMSGSGKMLRWVAVKGYNNDFSVYTHYDSKDFDFIMQQGDKVHGMDNIKNVLAVDEEVLKRYRH